MHAHWSLGVLIGLPLVVLVLLAAAAAVFFGVRQIRNDDVYDTDLGWLLTIAGGLVAVVVVAISAFAFFPYKASYHRWEPKSGLVTAIGNRFIGDGNGGTNQRFVVTLSGSPQQYACDDTRCSLLKVGDPLTLSCKKAYQYASEPGFDCNWVKDGAP